MRTGDLKILVVDCNVGYIAEPRLPRIVKSLGRYQAHAEGYRSPKRFPDGRFHDLGAYDLALVHMADAMKDNGAFHKLCCAARLPYVQYSGGTGLARAESERELVLSVSHVLAHAEDGIAFWQQTGRLDLTAWTTGLAAARKAAVNRRCEPLRRLLRSDETTVLTAEELAQCASLPDALRQLAEHNAYLQCIEQLSALLPTVLALAGEGKAAEPPVRRAVMALVQELVVLA